MQYVVSCLWFLLTLKFSCLFTAVAVLACLRSLFIRGFFQRQNQSWLSYTVSRCLSQYLKLFLFNITLV